MLSAAGAWILTCRRCLIVTRLSPIASLQPSCCLAVWDYGRRFALGPTVARGGDDR
jgi:hypothetical protein